MSYDPSVSLESVLFSGDNSYNNDSLPSNSMKLQEVLDNVQNKPEPDSNMIQMDDSDPAISDIEEISSIDDNQRNNTYSPSKTVRVVKADKLLKVASVIKKNLYLRRKKKEKALKLQ